MKRFRIKKDGQLKDTNTFVSTFSTPNLPSTIKIAFLRVGVEVNIPNPLGWSGGAMVLGKLPVPGRPAILITVGQGPIALAVGAGGGGLDIFTLIYPFSSFSLSLGDGPI